MLARSAAVTAFLLLCFIAQAQTVTQSSCGDDGKAHLTFSNGAHRTIAPERRLKQVGCDEMAVADDHHTVAWSVLVESCCTSYPIAIAIVVYRNGHKIVIHSPQMVWKWRFLDHGKRIAILYGPTHGWPAGAALFDSGRAKQVESWDGSGDSPAWAEEWEEEFQGRDQ